MRACSRLLILGLALVAPAAPAQEPAPAPAKALRELEAAAKELAKRGRTEALGLVLDALHGAGLPTADVDALRAVHLATAAKTTPHPNTTTAARAVSNAVKQLRPWFNTLSGEAKRRAAEVIVALDSTDAPAQSALGRTPVDGRWVSGVRRLQLDRRRELRTALQQARRLAVPIEEDESLHPVLTAVMGAGGQAYSFEGYMVHSTLPAAKVRRILQETLRATAVANWIVHGEVAVPEGDRVWVLLDSHATYLRSLAIARTKGWLDAKMAELSAGTANWNTPEGQMVFYGPTEAFSEVSMMDDVLGVTLCAQAQPCLESGLGNWVGLSYLGTPLPGFVWIERSGGDAGHAGRTTATPSAREAAERAEMQRIGKAGMAGCKAWMAFLARRREDPPWSTAFVDARGKIQGDDRLKATVVVEFLVERSPLAPIIEGTRAAQANRQERVTAFETVLGESLAEFEARWRRWLLPDLDDGVLQRLQPAAQTAQSPEDTRTLAHLNAIRTTALEQFAGDVFKPVGMIESLSEGCRLHGRYLAKHPAQAQAWPDAHEEYPDREGFTPEGCRAGGASVIAPGSRGPTDAIDGWMATLYHRLPLLHPGLVQIGWGNAHGYACLDAGSMVGPVGVGDMQVRWPAADQNGVPRRFLPELPNPVPGQDQSTWGYPVTLQFFAMKDETPQVVTAMTLRSGGAAVECWFITPERPHNPEIAPAGTYALIPKQHLKSSARYDVQATLSNRTIAWSFTTAR